MCRLTKHLLKLLHWVILTKRLCTTPSYLWTTETNCRHRPVPKCMQEPSPLAASFRQARPRMCPARWARIPTFPRYIDAPPTPTLVSRPKVSIRSNLSENFVPSDNQQLRLVATTFIHWFFYSNFSASCWILNSHKSNLNLTRFPFTQSYVHLWRISHEKKWVGAGQAWVCFCCIVFLIICVQVFTVGRLFLEHLVVCGWWNEILEQSGKWNVNFWVDLSRCNELENETSFWRMFLLQNVSFSILFRTLLFHI